MSTSTDKWFNNAKCSGLVTPDVVDDDLFADFAGKVGGGFIPLTAAQRVNYEARGGLQGLQASFRCSVSPTTKHAASSIAVPVSGTDTT